MNFTVIRKGWAVEIKRTRSAETDVIVEATAGIRWGDARAKRAFELRFDMLCRWPLVRASFKKGTIPLPTIAEEEEEEEMRMEEQHWAAYIAAVEWEEAERDEQWVAPGESRMSWSGVIGHDQPYVWRRR